MSRPLIDPDVVDVDGAVREAEALVRGDTRAAFFRKAAVGGGTVLTGSSILGMLPEVAGARPSPKQDIAILNYALTLEFLEAAFYDEAVRSGALPDTDVLAFATLVSGHEATHVKTLRSVIEQLGGSPVKRPTFDFKGANTDQARFIETAHVLENTGVRAYLGQAGRIKSRAILTVAATIATVEARHAAASAVLLGKSPYAPGPSSVAPRSFDRASSMRTILREVRATGFIGT